MCCAKEKHNVNSCVKHVVRKMKKMMEQDRVMDVDPLGEISWSCHQFRIVPCAVEIQQLEKLENHVFPAPKRFWKQDQIAMQSQSFPPAIQ